MFQSSASRIFMFSVYSALVLVDEWAFINLPSVEWTIGSIHVKMSGGVFDALIMTCFFAAYKFATRRRGGDYRVVQYAQVSDDED